MKDRNNQGRGVSSFTAILGIFFDFSRLAWLSAGPVFVDRNRAYFRTSLNLPTQAEIDRLWAEEAEQRIAQIDKGEIKLVPGKKVFANIRKKYRR
jgi:hypothetical protein